MMLPKINGGFIKTGSLEIVPKVFCKRFNLINIVVKG